jgi:acyl carrier protein
VTVLLDDIRKLVRALDASGAAASVGDQESLLSAGVIDSMAMIELIASLEFKFGIQMQDEDLTPENFDSFAAIRDLIQRKLDQGAIRQS